MYRILSDNLIKLAAACPFPLYVVGGRTRDFLAGLKGYSADTDICAPASSAEFISCAEKSGFTISAAYKNTGTVKITRGDESYEFASFRSDGYVRGEHVPSQVYFTENILSDARRRDFKCNAVYYDISARKFADPLGGIADISLKRITTTVSPMKVFGEDGLRLMRLARIAAQTGFRPDEECLEAARANARLIDDVSVERIAAELNLILLSDLRYGIKSAPYDGLSILRDTGVLKRIIPELAAGEGIGQRSDFHKYDVLEHSMRCAQYAPPQLRFAALLHDVGKPACMRERGSFVGHEERGAEIAASICERLKIPKKAAALTVRLVALHMYDFRCDARVNKVRKFIIENYDIFDEIMAIKQADFSACKDDFSVAPSVAKFKRIYSEMLADGVPFTLKQLNVRGNDLIEAGAPAAEVGNILHKLLLDCATGEAVNGKTALIDRACKVYLRK